MQRFVASLARVFQAIGLILCVFLLRAQTYCEELYLLSGTPTPKSTSRFATNLYRANPQSESLVMVRQVVGYDTGIDFVEADYDLRLIVLGYPPIVPLSYEIVNMDKPEADYSASLPRPSDSSSVVANYLIDVPGSGVGQALEFFHTRVDLAGRPIKGQFSDRLVVTWFAGPLNNREDLPWSDVGHLRCGGYHGTGAGSGNYLFVRVGSDGELIRAASTDSIGIQAPHNLTPPLTPKETLQLLINNREIAVFARGVDSAKKQIEPGILYVFRKNTAAWHRVFIPGGESLINNFSYWITGVAAQPNRDHLRHSPGRTIRKAAQLHPAGTGHAKPSMSVDDLFEQSETYFPGELFLYNAKTGKSYTISTGQGDSEVVLATDSAVYYRVNDTLFRAAVGPDSLGKPERLAQDPVIFQVHWAFLSAAQ